MMTSLCFVRMFFHHAPIFVHCIVFSLENRKEPIWDTILINFYVVINDIGLVWCRMCLISVPLSLSFFLWNRMEVCLERLNLLIRNVHWNLLKLWYYFVFLDTYILSLLILSGLLLSPLYIDNLFMFILDFVLFY